MHDAAPPEPTTSSKIATVVPVTSGNFLEMWMSFSAVCGLTGTWMLLSRRRGYGVSSRSGMSATT